MSVPDLYGQGTGMVGTAPTLPTIGLTGTLRVYVACLGCTPANVSGLYWHIPCSALCPYMSPTEARTVLPIPTPDGFASVSPLQTLTSRYRPGTGPGPFCPNRPCTVYPYVALPRSVPDPYINHIKPLPAR